MIQLPSFFRRLNSLTVKQSIPPPHNPHQLEKLLIIENPYKETIYGVIGRMEVLMDYFRSEPTLQSFIPFLNTYYLVTKASADKYVQNKHYFWSLRDYEVLDVYFSSLYFRPMYIFLTTRQMTKPWQHYFEYCTGNEKIASLQVMLGINAHINTDLYKSLIDLNYHHEGDFFLVNNVLEEVSPAVVKFLAADHHDLVGLSGVVFKDIVSYEFGAIIVKWRQEAWLNARLTTKSNQEENYEKILKNTERLATKLVSDFKNIYHLHNLSNSIKEVNSLSVKLLNPKI